jgi:hypothetical protein
MTSIYILKLQDDKYYVGKTNHLNFRLENHFTGTGSIWTTKYYPIEIVEIIPNCDEFDEDKYTKQTMMKYGIDNVRGGSYTMVELLDWQLKSLRQEFKSANDQCFICESASHFSAQCKINKYTTLSEIHADILQLQTQLADILNLIPIIWKLKWLVCNKSQELIEIQPGVVFTKQSNCGYQMGNTLEKWHILQSSSSLKKTSIYKPELTCTYSMQTYIYICYTIRKQEEQRLIHLDPTIKNDVQSLKGDYSIVMNKIRDDKQKYIDCLLKKSMEFIP